jgi:hypothetical protein
LQESWKGNREVNNPDKKANLIYCQGKPENLLRKTTGQERLSTNGLSSLGAPREVGAFSRLIEQLAE